jgi:hypothetical protein
MKLKDFLCLITDEESCIELEIDDPTQDEYQYIKFWYSDFLYDCLENLKLYKNYEVKGISFQPVNNNIDIQIQI